jgi:hypothetical protein
MKPNYLDAVDIEFKDLVKINDGDSDSGFPQDFDSRHPMPQFCEATDDIAKFFQAGDDEQELQKLNRSRMAPAPPESKPAEPQSVEEFFDCKVEKRSSSANKIRLTKRWVDGEVLIEGFDHHGTCVYTRVESATEISEGEPLAKAAITSSMHATLSKLRASLTAEEVTAAEKAIAALDLPAFLEIIRSAQAA